MVTPCELHLLSTSFPAGPHTTYSDLKMPERVGEEASGGLQVSWYNIDFWSPIHVSGDMGDIQSQPSGLPTRGTGDKQINEGGRTGGYPEGTTAQGPARGLLWFLDDHPPSD